MGAVPGLKRVMNRKEWLRAFGACSVLLLAGCRCSSVGYFRAASTLPEESHSSASLKFEIGCGRRALYPLACMNIIADDFRFAGELWHEASGFSIIFWPFIAIDLPISLCSDVVSMPWQIARYQDFPEDDPIDSREGRRLYLGPVVPEVLRALRDTQAADGRWTGGKSVLADTALVALALTERGDWQRFPTEDDLNFRPMLVRAAEYLVSCVDVSDGGVRLLGEDADPRAFPIAALALTEIGMMTRNPNICGFLPVIQTRLAKDLAEEKNSTLTPVVAERLGWMVLALEMGQTDGCAPAEAKALLDAVRSRLAGYAPLAGSYYETRQLYRIAYVEGGDEAACRAFIERLQANKHSLCKSDWCEKVVRGDDGKLHWACWLGSHCPIGKDQFPLIGLGIVADSALGVLQVSFPVSHRVPAKAMQPETMSGRSAGKKIEVEI